MNPIPRELLQVYITTGEIPASSECEKCLHSNHKFPNNSKYLKPCTCILKIPPITANLRCLAGLLFYEDYIPESF